MSLLMILLTIFLPPVAVALKEGIGLQFVLNLILTLIGWLPGVIHAFWVLTRGGSDPVA
ncbi:YqaE/Pmp3 family membrane protein [Hyphomonas beringensis]